MRAQRAKIIAALLVSAAGGVAACGSDTPQTPPQPGQATPAPAPAAGGAGSGSNKLVPMTHVEDNVDCPAPNNAKPCDPTAPSCDKGSYCLAVAAKPNEPTAYCGPCPERDAIRHGFKDRDFVAGETMRDPFQAGVGPQPATAGSGDIKVITENCRKDQLVATNYSYADLKLVGIVAQGTQRKVLMMDPGSLGQIIKLRDCVGKEKAIVKDIGAGYITFQVSLETGGAPKVEEHSVQLHPTQVTITSLPSDSTPVAEEKKSNAPVVTPPRSTSTTTINPGATVIVPAQKPQQPQVYTPPQAPTTLHP